MQNNAKPGKKQGLPITEGGFTLQELRELKSRGDLSEDEYEAARAMILGQYAAKEAPGTAEDDICEEDPEERPGHLPQRGEDGDSRGR